MNKWHIIVVCWTFGGFCAGYGVGASYIRDLDEPRYSADAIRMTLDDTCKPSSAVQHEIDQVLQSSSPITREEMSQLLRDVVQRCWKY